MIEYCAIDKSADEVKKYSKDRSLLFSLALLVARVSPMGKKHLTHYLGRWLGAGANIAIRTPHDAYLAVDTSSLELYTSMRQNGGWDEEVLAACIDLLQKGSTFYDIGANAGYMSVCTAAHFSGEIKVVAIEPQPTLAQAACRSMLLNGFTEFNVFPILLCDSEGEEKLYVTWHSVHASLRPRSHSKTVLSIPMTTLDALIENKKLSSPDVIKIDVEGAELRALKGGRNTLITHQPAIIFESNENAGRFGYSRRQLIEFLRECGYDRFYFIQKDGKYEPMPASDNSGVTDILALTERRITPTFASKVAG
jgi:FkbM family methyltransferase